MKNRRSNNRNINIDKAIYMEELEKIYMKLQRKNNIIRRVYNEIIHLLYILKDIDEYNKSYIWKKMNFQNFEHYNTKSLLIFSKLMMILKQRMEFASFLIVQKIQHIEIQKYFTFDYEIYEYTGEVCITADTLEQCKRYISEYSSKNKLKRNYSYRDIDYDDLGSYIIEIEKAKRRKSNLMKIIEKDTKGLYGERRNDPFDIKRTRRKTHHKIVKTIIPEPMIEDISEQEIIMKNFTKNRLKSKIDYAIISNNPNNAINKNILESLQKHRLSGLIMEITDTMRDKSPEIVETAGETFTNLQRIRELDTIKAREEFDINRRNLPNFVSAVINMKKSRNNERIGIIASKCSYFIPGKQSSRSDSTPRYMRKINIPYAPTIDSNYTQIKKRIKNIKTFHTLGKQRFFLKDAFETFCTSKNNYKDKQNSPKKLREKNIMMKTNTNIPQVDLAKVNLIPMDKIYERRKRED